MTVNDGQSKVYGENNPTYTATVTGMKRNDTEDQVKDLMSIELNRADGENVGEYDLYVGGEESIANYTIEYNDGKFNINVRKVTVTGASIGTVDFTGNEYSTSEVTFDNVVTGQTATIDYVLRGTEISTYEGTFNKASFKVMDGSNDVTMNYLLTDDAMIPGTLKITGTAKIEEYVTVTTKDVTVTYDGETYSAGEVIAVDTRNGKPVKVEYSVDGENWTEDPTTITATNVADTKTIQIRVTSDYYEGAINVTETLTIEKSEEMTISNADQLSYSGIYDGKTHSSKAASNVTDGTVFTYSTDGGRHWTEEVPSITDVGTVNVTVKASNPNYEDVTYDYTLNVDKRKVTLTSASQNTVYDATTKTNDQVSIGGDGFAEGEGAAFTVTGKQTDAGESKNIFSYTLNDGTKASNYDITTVTGTLTVEKRTGVVVTITGNSVEETYDGKGHTMEGYQVNVSDELYPVSDIRYSDNTKITRREAGTYNMGLSAEKFINRNPNFEVTFEVEDGILTIDKARATLTVINQTKRYGDAEPRLMAEAEGLVGNDKLNYTVVREGGDGAGTYVTRIELGDNPNYDVTTVDGTFTVNKRRVILTSGDKEGKYNGDSLVNTNVEIGGDGFARGEGVDVVVTGIQTGIGTTANTFTYKFWDNTLEDNYEIVKVEGNLIVEEAETHTMKVHFVDADGNEMPASFEKQYTFGSYYEIKAPELPGYTPDREVIVGRMGPEDTEVTVRYTPNVHKLVIRYVTPDGIKLADDVVLELGYGEHYRVDIPEFEGMKTADEVIEGTMNDTNAEITVMFSEDLPIELIVDYGTPLSVNTVSQPQGDCFE